MKKNGPAVRLVARLLLPAAQLVTPALLGAGCFSPPGGSPTTAAPLSTAPPGDASRCDAPRIAHYNNYFCCNDVQGLYAPSTVAQSVEVMKREILHGQGPVRVVGNMHTANQAICSAGTVLRTNRLKRIVGMEKMGDEDTVIAEAGVTIFELNRWLHDKGYSLGAGTLEFRDATVAGAVATGAHGSTLKSSSVISSRVRGLWLISPADVEEWGEAYASPREIRRGAVDDLTFRALAGNLGMAGFVTQVRLAVEPDYQLSVASEFLPDDVLWTGDGVAGQMRGCDWGQMIWFPRAGQVARFCGQRIDAPPEASAANILLDPSAPSLTVLAFQKVLDVMVATRGQVCVAESLRLAALRASPPQARKMWGLGRTSSSEVVGPAYDMMSSRLTGAQAEMKQNDFEVVIPIAQAPAALAEFKQYVGEHNLCLPLVGAFLRFGVADPGTLAVHTAAGKGFAPGSGVMFFEFVVYRPDGHTVSAADDYFGPYWWWAEHLIKKYGGRPHWAKNEAGLFRYALRENPDQAERLSAFRAVMDRFDPHHRFANAFTDETGLSESGKR